MPVSELKRHEKGQDVCTGTWTGAGFIILNCFLLLGSYIKERKQHQSVVAT